MAQIVSTWGVATQTIDEPAHIVTGLEWLQYRQYTIEDLHPPLARVAVALGPYLTGSRLTTPDLTFRTWHDEGNRILHRDSPGVTTSMADYVWTLSLARAGVLPFFVATIVLVWLWTLRLYGPRAAGFGAFLTATLPPLIGHSGLATTDMAAAATFVGALYAFSRWLEQPSGRRSLIAGAVWGLAFLAKFSNVLFLPVSAGVILGVRWLQGEPRMPLRPAIRSLALAGVAGLLMVWAGYLFSVQPFTPPDEQPHIEIDKITGSSGLFHDAVHAGLEAPVWPLKEFVYGLNALYHKNRGGHTSYFMGALRAEGVWYYFPTLVALKTPLPFLLLVGIGTGVILLGRLGRLGRRDSRLWVPPLAVAAVLASAMTSNINIGLRHVLAIYPLMAVVGGIGAAFVFSRARWGYPVTILLLGAQLASAIRANPDYLSYSNVLTNGRPELFFSDSDLDWGQDLGRLAAELASRQVRVVHLAYFGSADPERHGLPDIEILPPGRPVTGWVAMSMTTFHMRDGYSWLSEHEPVARIGNSIRLYYID